MKKLSIASDETLDFPLARKRKITVQKTFLSRRVRRIRLTASWKPWLSSPQFSSIVRPHVSLSTRQFLRLHVDSSVHFSILQRHSSPQPSLVSITVYSYPPIQRRQRFHLPLIIQVSLIETCESTVDDETRGHLCDAPSFVAIPCSKVKVERNCGLSFLSISTLIMDTLSSHFCVQNVQHDFCSMLHVRDGQNLYLNKNFK